MLSNESIRAFQMSMSNSPQPTQIPTGLRRQWQFVAGLAGLIVVAGYLWLWQRIDGTVQWAFLTALFLAVELLILRRNLHKNRPSLDVPPYSSLGWANGVTLARGAAYALMAGFLFAPRPGGLLDWAPALLYIGAVAADYCDGYLARITRHTTLLGEVLDMEFDGIGMLIALSLAVQYGQLPAFVLLLAAARPLFLWGMKLRERQGLPNHPMTPSDERRIAAGLLMGFVGVVLWPVFDPPATHIAGAVFGGAVAASFLRDWLVVIGWLKPASPAYIRWRARLKRLLFERSPLVLRIFSLFAAGLLVWTVSRSPGLWAAGLPSVVFPFFTGLGILAALAAFLGLITRLAGIGLVILACADLIVRGDSLWTLALLALGVLLVALGNGKPALWTPDERLLRRRAGLRADGAGR